MPPAQLPCDGLVYHCTDSWHAEEEQSAMTNAPKSAIDRQLPLGDEIFLDHVGHFVPDPQAASDALARIGFTPTPVSVQVDPAGAPTGSGNVCAMFARGCIEVLFQTAATPLA